MCGLAGIARLGGGELQPDADRVLQAMTQALAHRGPDDERILREGPVGLAFTRLSLVDPTGGGQPLVSPDGNVVLIANGEVYNHRELEAKMPDVRMRTGSDCEVLVHLYQRHGLRFLDDVRGMFGLALWDRKENRLILARDQFGVKPLFFARNASRIVFSSEIKALFQDPDCPRSLDWVGTLANRSFAGAAALGSGDFVTWFNGVEAVPSATILDIDLCSGETRKHRYWEMPQFDESDGPTDAYFIEELRRLLEESVRECATADTEIGLFLSGGIDSAAVAAFAATSGNLQTFSVLSGSTFINGDAENAHTLARHLGIANHQVVFPGDEVPGVEDWRRLLWLTEMPMCGPEQFYKYKLHRYVRENHPEIKGMLLGAAADEFLGGYTTLLSEDGTWDGATATLREMAVQHALTSRGDLATWWMPEAAGLVSPEVLRSSTDVIFADPYAAFVHRKFLDIQQYNCWQEDRTAAGNGIEARVPFLDRRLVELVAAIPKRSRERLLWDKRIVREAMRGVVPDRYVDRPKVPFYHGEGVRQTYLVFTQMLTQDKSALVEEALAGTGGRQFLDADGIRAYLSRLQRNPDAGHPEQLLRLINMGLLDNMVRELPAHPATAPAGDTPVSLKVTDWASESSRIEAVVIRSSGLTEASVLSLGEGVLLLRQHAAPDNWLVSVDGQLEFEINEREDGGWLRFLQALDGVRPLKEAAAEAGCTLDDIWPLINESAETGLLVS
ncbi:asparagine synthase (glutamine-hydrolyzing) [Streptomyces sp. MUM 178J]|uniref:asparagine synthase (glutamine-hydrolyzing) n=1 Tax=Streptomyces sp. MUM 178J TaxID=2791991 RepID=UPI001F050242|nr:asparagine synthase (glutamine-hydrolyzing) [Streptomyces sp. MUM 178J]WRQ80755.1 asparagine synthase (glutamine-hydrolyzing) [Streptomyces sp. MUM 178J]